VRTGTVPLPEFFGQLLRLIYRLIFLMTAEDRELLHMPGASVQARKLYADGYSLGLLRDRAVRLPGTDMTIAGKVYSSPFPLSRAVSRVSAYLR
jgi:hypothetical protein